MEQKTTDIITSTNHLAVVELKKLGYPIENIRKSLHKLTGIGQPDMARQIGTYRITISKNIDGTRNNPEIQDEICKIWEIPPEVLFEDKRDNEQ